MKNLHQFSPQHDRQRSYPFLVAIDMMLQIALSLAALVLTGAALMIIAETVWSRFFG